MPNKVRCKFKVVEMSKKEFGSSVRMEAVTANNEENAEFFGSTPYGSLEFLVTNKSIEAIEPGQEFFLDLTPVE